MIFIHEDLGFLKYKHSGYGCVGGGGGCGRWYLNCVRIDTILRWLLRLLYYALYMAKAKTIHRHWLLHVVSLRSTIEEK